MSSVARSVVSSGLRRTLTGPTIHRGTGSTVVGDVVTVSGFRGKAPSGLGDVVTLSTVVGDVDTLSGFRGKAPSALGDVVTLSTVVGDVGTLSGFRSKGPSGLGDVGTLSTVVAGVRNGPAGLGAPRVVSTFLGGFHLGSSGLRALPGTGICSSGRGAVGALTSPRGGVGSVPRAPGSNRSFSSSSTIGATFKSQWQKHKPGDTTIIICTLLGAGGAILYGLDTGFTYVLNQSNNTSKVYIDQKLQEIQTELSKFQGLATGTHHTFVRECNDATAAMQAEVSSLRARMLALEQKEFKYRKELLLASEILQKAGLDDAAAAAKSELE